MNILFMRVLGKMKLSTGAALKKATGKSSNSFYQVEETPAPIISYIATIASLDVKETNNL